MNPRFLLPLVLALAGCASDGDYPSLQIRPGETPRVIAPAAQPAPLSASARASISADIASSKAAVNAAGARLAKLAADLQRALAVPGVATAGGPAWSAAQVALSEYQDARSALADVGAGIAALQLRLDGVDSADPDARQVAALQQQLTEIEAQSATVIASASARLGS